MAFIIPHLGSFADDWRAQRAMIDVIARHPNVYTDTSGVRRFDLLVEAVRRAGPRKVLFGTDGPWLHPGVELSKVFALGLPARQQQLVLAGNWLRLTATARAGPEPRPRPADRPHHGPGDSGRSSSSSGAAAGRGTASGSSRSVDRGSAPGSHSGSAVPGEGRLRFPEDRRIWSARSVTPSSRDARRRLPCSAATATATAVC